MRRPRMGPAGHQASPMAGPQGPASSSPGAAQGCSRLRGAPQESLGARPTPLQVATARVPAVSLSSPRGVRVPAIKARRESGGPTRRAAVGAGSTNRIGGGHPPGRPGSALRRVR